MGLHREIHRAKVKSKERETRIFHLTRSNNTYINKSSQKPRSLYFYLVIIHVADYQECFFFLYVHHVFAHVRVVNNRRFIARVITYVCTIHITRILFSVRVSIN